ncbi:MAG: transcriptional regulator [Pseudomonas sp.]
MSSSPAPRSESSAIHELALRLIEIQQTLEQVRGTFIQEITDEDEYNRALALLDELTEIEDQHQFTERLIDQLCASIKRYEDSAPQFAEFNASVAALSGVQLLRFLMEQNRLTGSDLPEIGDKTVVSRLLNGKRTLSSANIQALAQRFHLDPGNFYPVV